MKTGRTGFTLIEVALAVLIVAIGVLAVAALFSTGLNSSTKAVADTQAAMFAENLFNGLRARSLLMAEQQTTNSLAWNNFWTSFIAKTTGISVAAVAPDFGVWNNATMIINGGVGAGSPYTNVFENNPTHGSGTTGIVDRVFRYRISVRMTNTVAVQNLVSARINTNCTWWASPVSNSTAVVSLFVWDGRYGSQFSFLRDALVFYSEFANQGNL